MEKLWCRLFCNSDDVFVACGTDEDDRPFFHLNEDGKYKVRPLMRYPECLKFMPYATVGRDTRLTQAEISSKFPGLLANSRDTHST